uniref:Pilus assembly protein PilO n=1 Tax=Eiseniibacteriota bacterium TaxID=2212470 RepID=A0A832MJL5_UNCEI
MVNVDLKNPAVQKILLASLVVASLLGVFFFTHFLPFGYPAQRDRIVALKADYEKKSTDLARARATVADLPRFEAEYEQLHQRWELAAELLPADRQSAALLRKITLAAQQTGVQFVSFRPAAPKGEQYYTELPLQISVNGGYHQVGSFLAELANLRRIVTVANVKLKQNVGNTTGYQTTSAEFTASAYSLNTTPVPAPGADAKNPKKEAANARKS